MPYRPCLEESSLCAQAYRACGVLRPTFYVCQSLGPFCAVGRVSGTGEFRGLERESDGVWWMVWTTKMMNCRRCEVSWTLWRRRMMRSWMRPNENFSRGELDSLDWSGDRATYGETTWDLLPDFSCCVTITNGVFMCQSIVCVRLPETLQTD